MFDPNLITIKYHFNITTTTEMNLHIIYKSLLSNNLKDTIAQSTLVFGLNV